MAKHACISIGINRYQFFQQLNFASVDAQALANFFVNEQGWSPKKCLLMTDHSAPVDGIATTPDRQNIQEWLDKMCWDILQPGDALWFFFSGYGINTGNAEYLVPLDGDPQNIQQTGISLANLYRQFSAPGIDVMVFLDVNRSQSVVSHQGFGAVVSKLSQEFDIPTFISCQSHEFSQEAMGLKHGIFTATLLEALRSSSELSIATLANYLHSRVPELSEHHWRPPQHPLIVIPNNGTIHSPLFAGGGQVNSNSLTVHANRRPEPARPKRPAPPQATQSMGLVPYRAPQKTAKTSPRPNPASLMIGIIGFILVVGLLLVAMWQQAPKHPQVKDPVMPSAPASSLPPS